MRHLAPAGELPPARPAKEAASEIAGMATMAVFFSAAIIFTFSGSIDSFARAISCLPAMGETVMQHIGWAFGVYIPVLLGFYAIVIGGQLVGDATTAGRTRRILGAVAEAMTAALVPALAIILATCIADPAQAGALFVIVPVSGVMFFLATKLGAFVVAEHALRLAMAESSRDGARQRLRDLGNRSRKPVWLVVIANTVAGGLIGTAIAVAVVPRIGSVVVLFSLLAAIALVLSAVSVQGVQIGLIAQDRSSKFAGWGLPGGMYLLAAILVANVFNGSGPEAGISVLSVMCFCAGSASWRRRSPRFLVDWTLRGAATKSAAQSVARTYARNVREIRELGAVSERAAPITFPERIIIAVRAFRDAASFDRG
ncbi:MULTISPECIES: hypothetical protein [unclassified Microbacterium]|uniref:hypothetical protein n=1 Tax=unclassified Microbacterium TaxID=2609290 RepID=UPI003663126A